MSWWFGRRRELGADSSRPSLSLLAHVIGTSSSKLNLSPLRLLEIKLLTLRSSSPAASQFVLEEKIMESNSVDPLVRLSLPSLLYLTHVSTSHSSPPATKAPPDSSPPSSASSSSTASSAKPPRAREGTLMHLRDGGRLWRMRRCCGVVWLSLSGGFEGRVGREVDQRADVRLCLFAASLSSTVPDSLSPSCMSCLSLSLAEATADLLLPFSPRSSPLQHLRHRSLYHRLMPYSRHLGDLAHARLGALQVATGRRLRAARLRNFVSSSVSRQCVTRADHRLCISLKTAFSTASPPSRTGPACTRKHPP